MKAHFRAYAEAYFTGFLFVLLQVTLAFLAQAKLLTPEIRAHMGRFDWLVFWNLVAAASIPTILAHLNGAVGRGRTNAQTARAWYESQIKGPTLAEARIADGLDPHTGLPPKSPAIPGVVVTDNPS